MTVILTVRVASTGAERYVVTRYDAFGGGKREWAGWTMDVQEFADRVAGMEADFVCVDETGLGAALIDMLAAKGIGVLRTHRMRDLP